MIVVRIELWPKGSEEHKRLLSTMVIANVGGDVEIGKYEYVIGHQEDTPGFVTHDPVRLWRGVGAWKRGVLPAFRRSLGAVLLVRNALIKAWK